MAAIYVITCPSHEYLATRGEYKYFSGMGAARKSAKLCLKQWKNSHAGKEEFNIEPCSSSPVMCINKWDIRTGRGKVLEALQTGEVSADSALTVECWSLNNDNQLYSWEGGLNNDPDLKVGRE